MKKKLTMFLAGLFLFVGSALAQTKVSGTVLSQEDGQPFRVRHRQPHLLRPCTTLFHDWRG